MNVSNSQFRSIEQLQDQYLSGASKKQNVKANQTSFQEILFGQVNQVSDESVKFSKHAASRLAERNIELTDQQIERLNDGTKKASEKGMSDSLVIVDQLAFIVNIPSNTVITAMDQTQNNENVYTNINGAVII